MRLTNEKTKATCPITTTGTLGSITALCFIVLSLLPSGCGRTDSRGNLMGPCVYDSDCPEGYRCIDSVCSRPDDASVPDALVLKDFGEPCEENVECRSTYCLAHPQGSFCTRRCEEGCPPGWECLQVPDPHGTGELVGLCGVNQNHLCQDCIDDLTCNVTGSDLCQAIGSGQYCTIDCTYRNCPAGYTCTDIPLPGGQVARQCWPDADTCLCNEETDGMVRGCQQENGFGTCFGYETCVAGTGWTYCSAQIPAPETCNGLDDDCNGFIDEDLVGQPCTVTNEHGSCEGEEICAGSAGWVCDAPTPEVESCDGKDNDCDGFTDEGFVDGQGRYVTDEHCGACGVDCSTMIPHAVTAQCQVVDDTPVCRATACEQGYFVYDEGAICMALPSNLCTECATDEDCLAPGSRCMEVGIEKFCGRDCSPQSPYGPSCPSGYLCQPYGPVLQCTPATGTCQCRADTLDAVRSCVYETCQGYQTCQQQGSSYSWSACNYEDYNVEICDGQDNNCNGQTDEGFLNPVTGRYESNEHCGFCNNDCSKYWTAEVHHVQGVCDLAPLIPECTMGPCLTEVEGGTTYEYVDVNGDSLDGCECRRVLGNTTVDPPDLLEQPDAGHVYEDQNCDGIDGVAAHALFVWAQNPAPGQGLGTKANPYKSINTAINAFAASGKQYILVAEGVYQENVVLIPGVKLHGGYSADFTHREVSFYATLIQGQAPPVGVGGMGAVHCENITNAADTIVSGFIIQGRDVSQAAVDGQPGQPTYAVYMKDCDDSVILRSNWILGGRGGRGGRGVSGAAGYGRQSSTTLDGDDGINAARYSGSCVNLYAGGGEGGVNNQCAGTSAPDGGWVVCPSFNWSVNPHRGAHAAYTSNNNRNGLGGYDWSFDEFSGMSCSHATESGFPSDMQSRMGQDGFPGSDGAHGTGGTGCQSRYGSISSVFWVPAPSGALSGAGGVSGQSGGGGGAGGGVAYYHPSGFDCPQFESGPTGGGGGAGGCGGNGGNGGQSGGASITIFVFKTSGLTITAPQILYNRIERGPAGNGGAGGFGGMGGLGGWGGFGGGTAPDSWISAQAGKGGDGGNGGSGGGGGGGCGGPSFGILGFNQSVSAYATFNEFPIPDTDPTGGSPGDGGGGLGTGGNGTAGQEGASRNLLSLNPCGSGGSCPSGRVCDANSICIPLN